MAGMRQPVRLANVEKKPARAVPSGSSATFTAPCQHIHSREEEGFSVLEGEITFLVGDKRLVARAGTFGNMPAGTLHTFKNESGKPARMLISVGIGTVAILVWVKSPFVPAIANPTPTGYNPL
jgi:hypothetical protein